MNAMSNDDPQNPLKEAWESIAKALQGFPFFFRIAGDMFRSSPGELGKRLNTHDQQAFWRALNFASYGLAVCFVLMLPVYLLHGGKVSRLVFIARLVTQFAVYGVFLHCSLLLLGARHTKLRDTLTDYFYVGGLCFPLAILLNYPILVVVGPKWLFGGPNDAQAVQATVAANSWVELDIVFAGAIVGLFGLVVLTYWLSVTHNIWKLQAIVAVLLGGLSLAIIQFFFLGPVFDKLFEGVDLLLEGLG